MNWKDSLNVFHHIYSKEYEEKRRREKKIMKVRDEIQEYPNKLLEAALMDKSKDDNYGEKTFSIGF